MFIPRQRGFKRQYVYGGAGIFDSIASFFTRLFTSSAAKQIASTALDAGKNAAKEIGKKAVNVGKNAALDAGKKLVERAATKVLTPKSQSILQKHAGIPMQQSSPDAVAKKAQGILSKYLNGTTGVGSISSLIDGSGVGAERAIAIQDLVRKLNGSGLKVV